MKLAEARDLLAGVVDSGAVTDASIGNLDKAAKALRRTHGGRTIEGSWPSSRPASIVCTDVARALAAGGWSVSALRACRHGDVS